MLFSCCAAGRRDSDKSWFVIVVVLVVIQLFTGRSSFSSQFCQCSICILVISMYVYLSNRPQVSMVYITIIP